MLRQEADHALDHQFNIIHVVIRVKTIVGKHQHGLNACLTANMSIVVLEEGFEQQGIFNQYIDQTNIRFLHLYNFMKISYK